MAVPSPPKLASWTSSGASSSRYQIATFPSGASPTTAPMGTSGRQGVGVSHNCRRAPLWPNRALANHSEIQIRDGGLVRATVKADHAPRCIGHTLPLGVDRISASP